MKQLLMIGEVTASNSWFGLNLPYVKYFLSNLQKGEEFEVQLHSPGGNALEGIAIYNELKKYKPKIYVTGLAASAASLVACAGKIIMGKGARLMIHNPWGVNIKGDGDVLRKWAKDLDGLRDDYLSIYKDNSTLSEEQIKALMKDTSYLSYDQLKSYGFDVEEVDSLPEVDKEKLAASIEDYSNAEASFVAHDSTPAAAQKEDNPNDNQSLTGNNPMPENNVSAAELGRVQAQLETANNQVNTLGDQVKALQTERDEAKASAEKAAKDMAALQEQLNTMAAEKKESEIKATVEKYVAAGKVPNSERETETQVLAAIYDNKELYQNKINAYESREALALTKNITDPKAGDEGVDLSTAFSYDPDNEASVIEANKRALAMKDKNPNMTYNEAFAKVIGGDQ